VPSTLDSADKPRDVQIYYKNAYANFDGCNNADITTTLCFRPATFKKLTLVQRKTGSSLEIKKIQLLTLYPERCDVDDD
jgi:hypothetical protein